MIPTATASVIYVALVKKSNLMSPKIQLRIVTVVAIMMALQASSSTSYSSSRSSLRKIRSVRAAEHIIINKTSDGGLTLRRFALSPPRTRENLINYIVENFLLKYYAFYVKIK